MLSGLVCRDAEFTELECRLNDEQIAVYDGAVQQWQVSTRCFASSALLCCTCWQHMREQPVTLLD